MSPDPCRRGESSGRRRYPHQSPAQSCSGPPRRVADLHVGRFVGDERDGRNGTRPVRRTFRNAGDEPLRFLGVVVPGAFAGYFEELAELLPEDEPPDGETMREVGAPAAEYGPEMDQSSVPELLERHDLRL